MSIFTYHLVKTSLFSAVRTILSPPGPNTFPGLIHAECMTVMTLGAPIFSPKRFLARQMVVFAQWEVESAVDEFLKQDRLGKILSKGWHLRLQFLRQWGSLSVFEIPEADSTGGQPDLPVAAVTIARMRLFQIPRFIRWGKPVEKLVRDHPGTTLSLASIRYPRTVSTFSIWKTQQEMTDMVQGHSKVSQPKRHIDAMKERNRKDFHWEFTTLRFKILSESGEWQGKSNYSPQQFGIK